MFSDIFLKDFTELSVVGRSVIADEESELVGAGQAFPDGANASLTSSPLPSDVAAK